MKTRREFLRSTLLGASATWTVPMFVERTFADLFDHDVAVFFVATGTVKQI